MAQIQRVCTSCFKTFVNKYELAKHVKNVHDKEISPGEETVFCATCSKSYNRKSTLLKHIKIVHTKNENTSELESFSCDSCGGSFRTKNELRNHIRSGHLENIIIPSSKTVLCTSCGKSYVNLRRLSRHLITIHKNTEPFDEREVLCIACDEFFDNIYLLEAHLKEAHMKDNTVISLEEKLEICTSCDEFFLSKYTLQHHLRTVHKENIPDCLPARKTKLCTSCGKYFSSQRSLRTHRKIVHNDYVPMPTKNERTEPCTSCGKYFINKHTLRTHLKVVHNENVHNIIPRKNKKTVLCTFCSKFFVSNKTLRRHLRNTHKEKFTVSSGSKTVSCTHCQNSFVNKYTLREHLRRVHKIEIPIEAFKEKELICDYCGKSFSSKSTLVQHMKNLHNLAVSTAISNEEKTKVCPSCSKRFVNNFTLREHMKRIHKEDLSVSTKKKTKLCTSCGKTFATNFTLRGHLKRIHKEDVLPPPPKNKTVPCSICSSAFTKFSTFRRHMENIHHQVLSEHHPVPKKDKPVKSTKEKTYRRCALCDETADGTREILYHYEDKHNLNMSYQVYAFDNDEDFFLWKNDVENNTRCSFKTSYTNRRANGTLVVYWCNRTGSFVSRSTGKRQSRTIGSKKINSFCPAHMRVDFTASGVSAKFISEHVGHETNKLCHMNLSKLERNEIVEQLREGVPPRDILRRMKYPLPTSKDDWKRVHLLTVRDIRYIGKRFGVYRPFGRQSRVTPSKRRQRNGTCVDSWVSANEDRVLYYKKKDLVDVRLRDDDFVLIVMSAEQTEALKTWGENVLTVDCARHLHFYGFVLTTVSVLDDCRRAFGACFMFSNRVDEALLRMLFETVKAEVGVLRVKTFVDDTTDECWNAWRTVFPEPKFRLYCPWHVLRGWRADLNEISLRNVPSGADISEDELLAIKKRTYRFLKMNLLRETAETTFESELNDFLERNVLLEGFRRRFRNLYSPTKRRWAYCFRKYAEMDDDVAADSFYKILKHSLGNRKRILSVDDALQAVSEYLNKKLEKEVIAEEKGWDDYKMAVLKIRHKKCLSRSIENVAPEGRGWLVESVGGRNGADEAIREIYFIEKVNVGEECVGCKTQCADCNACIHRFRCTCADSAVLMNMCMHIHLVCRYLAASVVELPHYDEQVKPKKEGEAHGARSVHDDGNDTIENGI